MREFIYFSNSARTSGNFPADKLMEAGRMDIVVHVLINAFFLSHKLRKDVKVHLIFNGPPNPPQHLELFPGYNENKEKISIPETGKSIGGDKPDISKKDMGGLIKKMLYKANNQKKVSVWPGFTIEKKSIFRVLDEMENENKKIYILDDRGKDIRSIEFGDNPIFILADHHGFNKKELKKLKSYGKAISVGKQTYFASQVVTIVNNELDRQER
ncbi:MAG: tRNA (pseudouridine(54)-N(1))-methyltransferase TrmY [Candidatus Pacearchaeota archaeon]